MVSVLVLCALLLATTPRAEASIPTSGQVVLIFVGVAVIGAAIGVGVYYAARRPASVTGCVAGGTDGLSLKDESDQQTVLLTGDTAGLRSGERVRVQGKRRKPTTGAGRSFVVSKMTKDFGPCKVTP